MRKKRIFKKIINILFVLFFVLIILIAMNFKVWKIFEKKEIRMFPIEDRCSILFNNILHPIKDEAGCETSCRSECLIRDLKFYNSEFYPNLDSCNICNCYCK